MACTSGLRRGSPWCRRHPSSAGYSATRAWRRGAVTLFPARFLLGRPVGGTSCFSSRQRRRTSPGCSPRPTVAVSGRSIRARCPILSARFCSPCPSVGHVVRWPALPPGAIDPPPLRRGRCDRLRVAGMARANIPRSLPFRKYPVTPHASVPTTNRARSETALVGFGRSVLFGITFRSLCVTSGCHKPFPLGPQEQTTSPTGRCAGCERHTSGHLRQSPT
jgi:hypothetical protein